MPRVCLSYQERQCAYPGCSNTFVLTRYQGARRHCPTCASRAAAQVIARHKPTPKGYRVYPPRQCANQQCGKTFDPVCAHHLYCCLDCRPVWSSQRQRARYKKILEKHGIAS